MCWTLLSLHTPALFMTSLNAECRAQNSNCIHGLVSSLSNASFQQTGPEIEWETVVRVPSSSLSFFIFSFLFLLYIFFSFFLFLTRGLRLGRTGVLRSLRHYLRAQSQGHQTIDRLEESGVKRRSSQRSSLKGREREWKGHRQWDEHWNCSKGDVGVTSKRLGGAHVGISVRTDTILNLTELNWTTTDPSPLRFLPSRSLHSPLFVWLRGVSADVTGGQGSQGVGKQRACECWTLNPSLDVLNANSLHRGTGATEMPGGWMEGSGGGGGGGRRLARGFSYNFLNFPLAKSLYPRMVWFQNCLQVINGLNYARFCCSVSMLCLNLSLVFAIFLTLFAMALRKRRWTLETGVFGHIIFVCWRFCFVFVLFLSRKWNEEANNY